MHPTRAPEFRSGFGARSTSVAGTIFARMWQSRLVPGSAPDGSPVLSVLGKQTYRFANGGIAELDEDEPFAFHEADSLYGTGNPATDAVRHESDLIAWKPLTDLVVHGKAHSPSGKTARYFDAGVQVGQRSMSLRVFGNRRVEVGVLSSRFTEPEPFVEMPLHAGFAFGGSDLLTDPEMRLSYPRNPAGKGFVVSPPKERLHGLELPNLENPARPLTPDQFQAKRYDRWRELPEPFHTGWTQKNSHPRLLLAGLPPDEAADAEAARQRHVEGMAEVGAGADSQPPDRLPILNPQYHNGAHPLLQFPYLPPGESIALQYMDPDHPRFEFRLPSDAPRAVIDLGRGAVEMDMVLHTIEIFKPTNRLTLVWRGSCRYAGISSLQSIESLYFDVFDPA